MVCRGGVAVWSMPSAGSMIVICDDQEDKARAWPGYKPGLSDAEWVVIAPQLPVRSWCGWPPVRARRVVANATLYVNRIGCAKRYLAKDFPPRRTVYGYFQCSRGDPTVQQPHHDRLRDRARIAAGRDPHPHRGGNRPCPSRSALQGNSYEMLLDGVETRCLVEMLDERPSGILRRVAGGRPGTG
jgi:transposase